MIRPVAGIAHLRWRSLGGADGGGIDVNSHRLEGDTVVHDHDFVEIALIVGGEARHDTIYESSPLDAGTALVIRPGAWHAYRRCRDLRVVNCCFAVGLLDRELSWLASDPRFQALLWPGLGTGVNRLRLPPEELATARTQLRDLGRTRPGSSQMDRIAHLLLLLGTIAAGFDSARREEEGGLAAASAAAVAEALGLLAADMARSWTVRELAAAVALSPTHLSRLFREAVGRPPMAHLARIRAEAAAARLLRGIEPVASVGAAVGWSDPNYFARRFRAHFGTSPSAYRRRAQRG